MRPAIRSKVSGLIASRLSGAGEAPEPLGELPGRLEAIEARLADLQEAVDYVRHVSEGARNNVAMVARRPGTPRPLRVLFLVHHPEAWYSLADVYAAMVASDDFHPVVASVPRHFPGSDTHKDEEYVHERFQAFGVPHLRFNDPDPFLDLDIVRAIDPHLILRQSQWDGDVPPAFHTPEIRFARLALVAYEPMNLIRNVVGEDGVANSAMDSVYQRNCWRVFCANERVKEMAAEWSEGTGARQFHVTGHPKADVLRRFAGSERPEGHRFTVLWSAHHSVTDDWTRFGTFPTSAPAMLRAAREHPDWDFVFSPHPALVTRLEEGEWPLGSDEIRGFRSAWDALPNTEVFGGGNYGPVFERSGVLISDGLSWLLEYQLVNKPVLFLERPGHQPFNDLGARALQGTHTVASVAEAAELFARFAAGERDPLAAEQRAIVKELFGEPGAAQRIIDAILQGWSSEGEFAG